ncbi:MAG: tRNA (adenosine(37)-N6)-threonylcarbamoyltransferase complex transferase subunit TsaD [bacterium]
MVTLALETSCDDTCAALVTSDHQVLSSVVSSQDEIHAPYQGVVPELASRRHCENINPIIREALNRAERSLEDLTAVAVTYGPGLVGSLLTGVAAAKSIKVTRDIPMIPVNHIEAHIYSVEIENSLTYPYLSLVASGGHTVLLEVEDQDNYGVLGHTRDDAVGEAYDKVAKMLDLGYPGGPHIENLAKDGDPTAVDFPRPTLRGSKRWGWSMKDYDFSFSGIKTAVYYYLRDHDDIDKADVAASFQRAVNDVLVHKTVQAAQDRGVETITVGGGVAANTNLRESFRNRAAEKNRDVVFPSRTLCTDNAAMIGYRANFISERAGLELNAQPRLSEFTHKKLTEEKVVK